MLSQLSFKILSWAFAREKRFGIQKCVGKSKINMSVSDDDRWLLVCKFQKHGRFNFLLPYNDILIHMYRLLHGFIFILNTILTRGHFSARQVNLEGWYTMFKAPEYYANSY